MPTLLELQKRLEGQDGIRVRLGSEEELIADLRGEMRPGELIEQKLRAVEPSDESLPFGPVRINGTNEILKITPEAMAIARHLVEAEEAGEFEIEPRSRSGAATDLPRFGARDSET
jgi:hypothetical protein